MSELKVPPLARRVVSWIQSYPRRWAVLMIALLVALSPGLGRVRADFTHRGFFYDSDPLLQAFDAFERQFGNDDRVIVALHSPSGIFDVDSAKLLGELTEKMWLVPEVIRVDSLANYNWVHADGDELIVEPFLPDDAPLTAPLLAARKKIALAHEVLPRYLISPDGRTALIHAAIKPGLEAPPDAPKIVGAVRKLTKGMMRTDHTVFLSGGPTINVAFKEASEIDVRSLYPLVLLMVILLLAVTLRSLSGVLLSLVVVFLSTLGAMSFAGWTSIEMTNITLVLPQILVAIGVADAVHIIVVYRRSRQHGLDRQAATEYSLLKNFMPTVITTLTTSAGFLSFTTADLKPVAGLGVLAAFGTVLAWLLTYFLLGPLLYLLPLKVREAPEKAIEGRVRRSRAFVGLLARARPLVVLGFAALSVGAAVLAARVTVNSDPFKYFQEGYWMRVANDFIEAEVGGARSVEVVVDAGSEEGIKDPAFMKKVAEFQGWIDTLPGITKTVSIVDVLKQTHRSLHGDDPAYYQLPDSREALSQELFLYTMSLPQGMNINDRVTIKNDAVRISVFWTIPTSKEATEAIARMEAKGASMGLAASVTGKYRLYQSMNGYVVRSMVTSVAAAVFLISLILIVFFRSVRLGLAAMVPNVVPLVIGGGVLVLIGKPLDIGVALVMSVCLGIAVDDTIHVLSNYRRLIAEGRSAEDAVTEIFAHTSPALIVTTLVLVCGFGTFAFATFTPNLYLGVMTAIILTVALVTDLVFLPALLLGPRNLALGSERGALAGR